MKMNEKQKILKLEWVKKSNKFHNNFYDYSIADYVNSTTLVDIICPLHGIVQQKPEHNLQRKCNCCLQANKLQKNKNNYIQLVNKKHNNKYDYSNINFINHHCNINIICDKHGEWNMPAISHKAGHGCPKCQKELELIEMPIKEFKIFKEQIKNKYPTKHYDFTNSNYVNSITPIEFKCKVHGIVRQQPNGIINLGCKHCNSELLIKKQNIINGINFKNYMKNYNSKIEVDVFKYINGDTKLEMFCTEHNEIFLQSPASAKNCNGCPECQQKYNMGGFNVKLPAYIYLHKIVNKITNEIKCYKFGITNKDIKERLLGIQKPNSNYIVININSKHFEIGQNALDIENYIKHNFECGYHITRDDIRSGFTETLNVNDGKIVDALIGNLIL